MTKSELERLLELADTDREVASRMLDRLPLGRDLVLELINIATTDGLTMLRTREFLEAEVVSIIEQQPNLNRFGLLVVTDLVGFKKINDNYGMSAGDDVLARTAQAFTNVISRRRNDRLTTLNEAAEGSGYRLGGDEFSALLKNGQALQNANVTAIAQAKALAIIQNTDLVQYLLLLQQANPDKPPIINSTADKSFGIRVGAALVDCNIHANFSDVLRDADPKQGTLGEYRLVLGSSGVMVAKMTT